MHTYYITLYLYDFTIYCRRSGPHCDWMQHRTCGEAHWGARLL